MSAGPIILIIVIVILLIVIGGIVLGARTRQRTRRRLSERFGPEYDRAVSEHRSRRLAEAELSSRERRVQKLSLTALSDEDRERYSTQWEHVQERFVEAPPEAVGEAQSLVEAVMRDRGYPVTDYEQTVADLSVQHARVLDRFRSAHVISEQAASGQISTESLRTAMLYYRELFGQLLGTDTTAQTTAQTADTMAPVDARPGAAEGQPRSEASTTS